MFNKTKHKGKKCFCKNCLQCFSCKNVLIEHKKDCLVINRKQNVKLESGFISFKIFSRQIPVSFKIYADFECVSKSCDIGVDNKCFSYTKNIRTIFHTVLPKRLCVLIINLAEKLFSTEEKKLLINLLD